MTSRSWLRCLFAPRTPRTARKAPPRWRPSVEALEMREVPAAPVITPSLDFQHLGSEGTPMHPSATAYDPDAPNDPLTYAWTVTRPDGSVVDKLTGASTNFVPPDNGVYSASLTVTDTDEGRDIRSANPNLVGWWSGEGTADGYKNV